MTGRVLVLGGSGMLGRPVVRALVQRGRHVRVMTRSPETARRAFGDRVEIAAGDATSRADLEAAIRGCDAVHVNLTQEADLAATRHVCDLARPAGVSRLSYVSATTAREENRWFPLVDAKLRSEEALRESGLPVVVFCPTWAMETLRNFVHRRGAAIIRGRNPPPLHFLAAADFGRIVADSYEDERALGRRLFVHGPEAITLPDALARYLVACHPRLRVLRLSLWQARVFATVARRKELGPAIDLIDYFDRVGELGDPGETNALFGAPATTLEEWFRLPDDGVLGRPH